MRFDGVHPEGLFHRSEERVVADLQAIGMCFFHGGLGQLCLRAWSIYLLLW
jgi:hypothetical protein